MILRTLFRRAGLIDSVGPPPVNGLQKLAEESRLRVTFLCGSVENEA